MKTILMFIKNIIAIKEANYLVIHYPFNYFRKSWEKADGSVGYRLHPNLTISFYSLNEN